MHRFGSITLSTEMPKLPRLRFYRERQALSQRELAKQARVGRVTIARIEAGEVVPHGQTIRKLAKTLGVQPADLMGPAEPSDEAA
jgi:transcriptional regulator with XRE-family HTH domain